MTYLFLLLGLALLIGGAELLIRNAAFLASALGISALVIGLTVVAYGTSAPEVAVSIRASLAGQGAIAIGNVVGSNIFNIMCILGLSALILPLSIDQQFIRYELPVMLLITIVFILMTLNARLGFVEGGILFVGIIVYSFWTIRSSSTASPSGEQEAETHVQRQSGLTPTARQWVQTIAGILLGLALLVLGSRWFVEGAIAFARTLGFSDRVIGLTIVAAGTSLPELTTSGLAALKKERDIAVANVIGSNIFNILGIIGASALLAPNGLQVPPAMLQLDLWILLGTTLLCLPFFVTDFTLTRLEGGLLLILYVAYLGILIVSPV